MRDNDTVLLEEAYTKIEENWAGRKLTNAFASVGALGTRFKQAGRAFMGKSTDKNAVKLSKARYNLKEYLTFALKDLHAIYPSTDFSSSEIAHLSNEMGGVANALDALEVALKKANVQ